MSGSALIKLLTNSMAITGSPAFHCLYGLWLFREKPTRPFPMDEKALIDLWHKMHWEIEEQRAAITEIRRLRSVVRKLKDWSCPFCSTVPGDITDTEVLTTPHP